MRLKPVKKLVNEVNKLSHKVKPKDKDFYAFLCYCIKTLDEDTTFQEIFL
ncbi:hypothetical protein AtEden1_Chr1g0014591 [Arabidopsis thaliana]